MEFLFFLLRTPHRGGQFSNLRLHIIYSHSKFSVSWLLRLDKLCYNVLQILFMWRLVRLMILISLVKIVKALARISQKILVALDFGNEELDLKTLGFKNFDLESFGLENLSCFEKDFKVGCLYLRKHVLHHSSS